MCIFGEIYHIYSVRIHLMLVSMLKHHHNIQMNNYCILTFIILKKAAVQMQDLDFLIQHNFGTLCGKSIQLI